MAVYVPAVRDTGKNPVPKKAGFHRPLFYLVSMYRSAADVMAKNARMRIIKLVMVSFLLFSVLYFRASRMICGPSSR